MSKHFNPNSEEDFMDAKIIEGNPSGIINFGRTPHKWAYNIYRLMENNAWFPEECNLGDDTVPYRMLSEDMKYAYDMVLAQLSENDSVQTSQLMDDIARYITSPMVKTALVLQAYQEANHARSYTVTAETVCDDPDKIYELYKTEPALLRKNNAVSKMYEDVTMQETGPTPQELIVAFAANQILEELVFPGGFVVMWSFGFKGTSKMISFIQRD